MIIQRNRCRIWAGLRPAHIVTKNAMPLIVLCLSGITLLWAMGCGGSGQSVDVLFATANTQLDDARKAGAEQYAKSELEEAVSLLAEAEAAIESEDKGAQVLLKKAMAKAKLAEALTRQLEAESETAQLETELEKASSEAAQARQERQAAESKLVQMTSE